MEQKLEKIFENVNRWLSFAEAKNAAIVAFDGVAIFGLLRLTPETFSENPLFKYVFGFVVLMLLISLFISLCSFIAKSENISETDNLLFYDHICKYNSETYLNAIFKKYNENQEPSEYEKELAQQIVINSKIAGEKYKKFNYSIFCIICSIMLLFAFLTYFYFNIGILLLIFLLFVILWFKNYLNK
ncbi:Ca2+/Na+ antiporter [Methanococcus voltae]|uniref:Pycsar system effector family protein n=1 Tax=Methanococcus voltae TaxID=2188 RepID=UPI001AE5CF7F|nr:Pycsar system effector family protein [Methanococcus voltae]MBP2143386.1 Ca2+/Na+ antiporter [Methanococcus voltae]